MASKYEMEGLNFACISHRNKAVELGDSLPKLRARDMMSEMFLLSLTAITAAYRDIIVFSSEVQGMAIIFG